MKKQLKNKTVCAIIRTNQELAGLCYSFAYKSFHKSPFSSTKSVGFCPADFVRLEEDFLFLVESNSKICYTFKSLKLILGFINEIIQEKKGAGGWNGKLPRSS